MSYKGIIFDLDGVLVFTDQYHYTAWKTIADKLRIPFDEEVNNRLRGVSRMESLEIILSNGSVTLGEEEKIALSNEKNNTYRTLLETLTTESVFDETKEVLHTLKSRGLKLAIGSSSQNAEFILKRTGIISLFDAVVSGNHIRETKPNPEVFLTAANQLGFPPVECLVVEDAYAGIQAASQGGFASAGIGDAYGCEGTTYPIKQLTELLLIS